MVYYPANLTEPVGEISITADARDCVHAIRRANTTHLATGMATMPIVVADTVPDDTAQEFGDRVTFLIVRQRPEAR